MTYRATRICYVLPLAFALSASLLAQQDRIAGVVERRQTVALKGNTHPDANPQFDAGPVDPSLQLDRVTLMLKRSAAQQAALDQLLADQQNPASPGYHVWLTPEHFADRFGLSQNDIDRVASWLQSEGLTVDEISRSRNWISFSGSAEQMRQALRTDIRSYRIGQELHFANVDEPSVPGAIAPFVLGVLGLDDFRPRAARSRKARISMEKADRSLRPKFTSSEGEHLLTPDDFATIYNLNPLLGLGYDGAGQRIVIAGQSAIDLLDIQVFRLLHGLPANDPQVVLVPGTPDPGINSFMEEADLDIEWAGAAAPKASIIYVYSPNVMTLSLIYAVDQNLAPIISYSFGQCEERRSESTRLSIQAVAQQANAQGITLLVTSGDAGAADCDTFFDPAKPKANFGLAVDFPASLPEVTAVGGTQFDEGTGNYWSSSNTANLASALSYIPEKGWNESSDQGLAASGGGLSTVFPKPLWQTGPGTPAANFRAVPDVSLSAADHDGYIVVTGGDLFVFSGTSASTPAFAGILALVNQYQVLNGVQTRSGQGNINPNLYSVAQKTAGVFHDITAGNNVVPCVTGTKDCPTGTLGYSAGPGYDLVTGLGSVDGFNLAVNLAKQWITPAVAQLSPNSVIAGGGGFTLGVSGSGFDPASVVQWMGAPLPTKFVSGTQLLATVNSPLIASAGSISITVLSAAGVSAPVSLVITPYLGFTITDPRVTTTVPPASGCALPPPMTSFKISDRVYLYFTAKVTTNNQLSYDWITPEGALAVGGRWPVVPGFFCYTDASLPLPLVGVNPVGTWQARVFDHGNLIISIPFTVSVPGNQTTPLAHAADGNGFKTTVLLTNAGTGPAPYTLRFNDDHGDIPLSRFELETGALSGVIPAGESVTIRTAGLGKAVVTGWAELTAPTSVGGSVIYSQKTNLPSVQEGTATIVASGSHFFLPFDNTSGAITGVGLTNPGGTAAKNIAVTIRYSDGSSEVLSYPQLAGRNHQAFAIAAQFPHTANRSGAAEFTSDVPLSVVAFRFNSTGAFTAFDATPAGAGAISMTRPLAHAADGNGFKTTVLLTNAGTAAAQYTLRFNDDEGKVPATRFELESGSLTGVIPAGGSVIIRTAGLGTAIVTGWAELTAPASVGGSVIYSQKTDLPSVQEGTATIVASGGQHFFLPFDNTAGALTGVALTVPGGFAANNITIRFRYSDGTSEVVSFPHLPSRTHQAFAIAFEYFQTFDRKGVAEFTSDVALSAVAFRFNSTGAFTSFGVVVP